MISVECAVIKSKRYILVELEDAPISSHIIVEETIREGGVAVRAEMKDSSGRGSSI